MSSEDQGQLSYALHRVDGQENAAEHTLGSILAGCVP